MNYKLQISKKRLMLILGSVVLLGGLGILIYYLQYGNFSTRSKASANDVTLRFQDATITVKTGEAFTENILVSSQQLTHITAAELHISYPKSLIVIDSIAPVNVADPVTQFGLLPAIAGQNPAAMINDTNAGIATIVMGSICSDSGGCTKKSVQPAPAAALGLATVNMHATSQTGAGAIQFINTDTMKTQVAAIESATNVATSFQGMNITVESAAISPTPTPTPPIATLTPTPSLTPPAAPGSTKLGITVYLHGIGNGGDNVSPDNGGNPTPVHTNRPVTVDLYNQTNTQLVSSVKGMMTYDSTAKNFQGVLSAGALPTGNYIVKFSVDQFLHKYLIGAVTVTSGQTNIVPTIRLEAADANLDNQINILDWNFMLDCYGDVEPAKRCYLADGITIDTIKKDKADIDDDGKVNLHDLTLYQKELANHKGD